MRLPMPDGATASGRAVADPASAAFRRLTVVVAVLAAVALYRLPGTTAADDTVVGARPPQWPGPAGEAAPLVAFDLKAECEENERRRAAGQAHNVACFMLRDYMQAYHPGADFAWRRCAKRVFGFVGTRRPDDETLQEVFVGWQSFSDGLQWGFTEVEITRDLGTDPFAIVADGDARRCIRNALGPDDASRPCDVFLQRTRVVTTDQVSGKIPFPPTQFSGERYGVFLDGRVRFFTPSGEPIQDARRP